MTRRQGSDCCGHVGVELIGAIPVYRSPLVPLGQSIIGADPACLGTHVLVVCDHPALLDALWVQAWAAADHGEPTIDIMAEIARLHFTPDPWAELVGLARAS